MSSETINTINALVLVDPDTGRPFTFDGPFSFARDGGDFETVVPIGTKATAVTNAEADTITDAGPASEDERGDIALALADGGVEAGGRIAAADRIEDRVFVRVDDPTWMDSREAGIDLSEVGR